MRLPAQGFLSLTALRAEGCGGAHRTRRRREGSKGFALWTRKVLKFDRPFAGGFLGLTVLRGPRVVVSPLCGDGVYKPLRGKTKQPGFASVGRFIGRPFYVQVKGQLRPTWSPSAGAPHWKCTPIPATWDFHLKVKRLTTFCASLRSYKMCSLCTPEGEVLAALCF